MEKDRRTGKSTKLAFKYIYEAMEKDQLYGSEIWTEIKDHFGTAETDKYLMESIREIIQKLDLKGFKFSNSRIAITCNFCKMGREGFDLSTLETFDFISNGIIYTAKKREY